MSLAQLAALRKREALRVKKYTIPAAPLRELQPLRLVGGFCDWLLEVPGLVTEIQESDTAFLHRLRFVQNVRSIEFQIVSDRLGFAWRIFPDPDLEGGRLQCGMKCREALMGGSRDGHNLNFCIEEPADSCVDLLITLQKGKDGVGGPPDSVEIMYRRCEDNPPIEIRAEGVSQLGDRFSADARLIALEAVEPIRLCGKPTGWSTSHKSLNMDFHCRENGFKLYHLCFRMLSPQIEFQIVSGRLGFRWRLAPAVPTNNAVGDIEQGAVEAMVAQDEKGHGRNFMLRGKPLSAVMLVVKIEEVKHKEKSVTGQVLVGCANPKHIASMCPKVGIAERKVQFPFQELSPLGEELLDIATTQEEKDRILELRYNLLRAITWQLQLEYSNEDVQRDVIALRHLYPYRQAKGMLALEVDKQQQATLSLENDTQVYMIEQAKQKAVEESDKQQRIAEARAQQLEDSPDEAAQAEVDTAIEQQGTSGETSKEREVVRANLDESKVLMEKRKELETFLIAQLKLLEEIDSKVVQAKLTKLREVCKFKSHYERGLRAVWKQLCSILTEQEKPYDWYDQALPRCTEISQDAALQHRAIEERLAFGTHGPLQLEKGDCVIGVGLQRTNKAKAEAMTGVLEGYDEQRKQYHVSFISEGIVALRPENLRKTSRGERILAIQAQLLHESRLEHVRTKILELRARSADKAHFERLREMHVVEQFLQEICGHYGLNFPEALELGNVVKDGTDEYAKQVRSSEEQLDEALGYHESKASASVERSPLLGHWKYGSKGLVYTVSVNASGYLHFNGPHTSGRVCGWLSQEGSYMKCELFSTTSDDHVGSIRLRFENGRGEQSEHVISNFKGKASTNWNKDISATKVDSDYWETVGVFKTSKGMLALQADSHTASNAPSDPAPGDTKALLEWHKAAADVIDKQLASIGSSGPDNADVRGVHAHMLKLQNNMLSKQVLKGEVSSRDLRNEVLFGDSESQFTYLLGQLPSVQKARARSMEKFDLPASMALRAIKMGEQRHQIDKRVFEANNLSLSRLRVWGSPHPDTLAKAAKALSEQGCFVGTPSDFFWGIDTDRHADWFATRKEVELLWSAGAFKNWFGGPKAGKFMVTSADELWDSGCKSLFGSTIVVKDQLNLLIKAMGSEGKNLRVEERVLVAYHPEGNFLPPWEDLAGKRTRRLSFSFHLSTFHTSTSEGGHLRLYRRSCNSNQSHGRTGLFAEVPAGGANWVVFRTNDFKQEIARVRLKCGRWCLTVCAEDVEIAKQLQPKVRQDVESEIVDNCSAKVQIVDCDCCHFSGGDGVALTCPENHHVCRDCLHKEIRAAPVPTCPACALQSDRVYAAQKWDLLESQALDEMGCVCNNGSIGTEVDPGTQAILYGHTRSSGMNGKLAEAIWFETDEECWHLRLFATGCMTTVGNTSFSPKDPCESGGGLRKCPCWPRGRGMYPISLGSRCAAKLGIDECTGDSVSPNGYPYWHGTEYLPFDSLKTSLEGVLYFLRHNFNDFFHYNDMLPVSPRQCPHVVFKTYRSTIHAFPHHHPVLDQAKMERRIDRFRLVCRHARDTRGARPVLFVRFLGESAEIEKVVELYCLLRLWAGPSCRLCCVCGWQVLEQRTSASRPSANLNPMEGEIYRHDKFPRILFWLVGAVPVMDFVPIRRACKFAVYDEAGLLSCPSISTQGLLERIQPFSDPYTTKSEECPETWLTPPVLGEDLRFFADCRRASLPEQGREENKTLWTALRAGNLKHVQACLGVSTAGRPVFFGIADANSWDTLGRTPLQSVVLQSSRGELAISEAVPLAASLLLAHADPNLADRSGETALHNLAALRRATPPGDVAVCLDRLEAMLSCAVLSDAVDSLALYSALEQLGEPLRSRLSLVLALGGLRAVGEAELCWRNPPPDSETILAEVEEQLKAFEQLPEIQRKQALKKLLLAWHPDKNAHRLELSTTVFQFVQTKKSVVVKR